MTPYTKDKLKYLRQPFEGAEKINKNYSQSYQDIFALTALNGKKDGVYLEIGAFDPIYISNTYILEKDFNWKGISIDIEEPIKASFESKRKNDFILSDALIVDYKKEFEKRNYPKQIDYLSIDIEPKTQTLECLKRLPLDEYRFSVITYETDYYDNSEGREIAEKVRNEARQILQSHGYILLVGNIANTGPNDIFEDWYVDPSVIDKNIIQTLQHEGDFNDSAEKFLLSKDGIAVCTELWNGQGLGNQLWSYIVTRIIADKRNANFSIIGREKFKGKDFMEIDFGKEIRGGKSKEGGPAKTLPDGIHTYYKERRENLENTTIDISRTDPSLFSISLNSKIDGGFQSVKYLEGYKNKIKDWIKIKDEYKTYDTGENACVIHLRAGDFSGIKDVFLPSSYYKHSMNYITSINPQVKFYCVTDQKDKAAEILPGVEIIGSSLSGKSDEHKAPHHWGGPIGIDFSYLMNAKYLILSNSSFSWWAGYLNDKAKVIVAPKYWAAYNTSNGYWSTSDIITDGFIYIDRNANLLSAQKCWEEKEIFESKNPEIFTSKENTTISSYFYKKIVLLKMKIKSIFK